MSAAQILFSVALGAVTLLVVAFAVYVISSAAWGDRWVKDADPRAGDDSQEGG